MAQAGWPFLFPRTVTDSAEPERAGRGAACSTRGRGGRRVRRKFKNNGQAGKVGPRAVNAVHPHLQTVSPEHAFVGLSSKRRPLPPTFNGTEASYRRVFIASPVTSSGRLRGSVENPGPAAAPSEGAATRVPWGSTERSSDFGILRERCRRRRPRVSAPGRLEANSDSCDRGEDAEPSGRLRAGLYSCLTCDTVGTL